MNAKIPKQKEKIDRFTSFSLFLNQIVDINNATDSCIKINSVIQSAKHILTVMLMGFTKWLHSFNKKRNHNMQQ